VRSTLKTKRSLCSADFIVHKEHIELKDFETITRNGLMKIKTVSTTSCTLLPNRSFLAQAERELNVQTKK